MRLIHPVNPDYVRISQNWRVFPRHSGRDYRYVSVPKLIPESKQVRAAAEGKVVRVIRSGIYNQGYGNQIIIQHTSEIWTTYNHLLTGSITVKVGDTVKAGQLMATMGATGKTKPVGAIHLHFEVRKGGIGEDHRVNPAPYFTQDLPGVPVIKPKPAEVEKFTRPQLTTASLKLRNGASTSAKVILTMPKNSGVLTGRSSKGWVRVAFTKGGKVYKGWASEDYLIWRDRTTNTPKKSLNLRAKASAKGKVIASIPSGTKVRIDAVSGPGKTDKYSDTPWGKVTYKGKTGWVAREFLR